MYLCVKAYARPNQPEAIVFPPIETLPEVPEAPKVPNTDGSGYVGLPGFLVDMSKILDRYIPTFDPNMKAKKQEEKKKTNDMMEVDFYAHLKFAYTLLEIRRKT
ncbi:hypothetical protein HF086_000140 [Spodoptera exigua]|uniref:Uncharacterized protein n=1 Tax=Spodoptera exigua TaxID=7107 RepID=A0A922SAZ5_SPOEX|nr:hypothetical protein HF086_000140 [Spodoptera exigua]